MSAQPLAATRTAARIATTDAVLAAVLADTLSDTDLAAIVPLYPQWVTGERYVRDNIVSYDRLLYRCLQDHTAQADWIPAAAVSLWTPVRQTQTATPDEWRQPTGGHDAYNIGDRVTFEGHVYESLIDNNVWSPSAYPQGWNLIS